MYDIYDFVSMEKLISCTRAKSSSSSQVWNWLKMLETKISDKLLKLL